MVERSYTLLATPLDLHASNDDLIRNYELVRQNIQQIAPTLPPGCEIELIASETSHNPWPIPLLGLYIPESVTNAAVDPSDIQNSIDEWFSKQPVDKIKSMLNALDVPTWDALLKSGTYPSTDD